MTKEAAVFTARQVSPREIREGGVSAARDAHNSRRFPLWSRFGETGQELVEFAVVFPLLILFVFGVLDLGRLFFAAIAITNAAREGARYGIFYPDDEPGIRFATRREAQNSGIDLNDTSLSTILVSCPPAPPPLPVTGCVSGNPLRVQVNYNVELLMTWLIPGPVTVTRYAEMLVP